MKRFFKKTAVIFGAAAISVLTLTGYYSGALPDSIYTESTPALSTLFSITADRQGHIEASAGSDGAQTYTLKLFGAVPIKDINAKEQTAPMLVPCGEPFGIRLITDGVLVVDLQAEGGFDGKLSPYSLAFPPSFFYSLHVSSPWPRHAPASFPLSTSF